MNRKKYLFKNTFVLALGSVGTKLISFFLVPLYTHALTTSEYGVVDLISTICTLLIPVLTLNIGESVMRFALDKGMNSDKTFSVGILSSVVFLFLAAGLTPICFLFSDIQNYALYVFLFFVMNGVFQIFQANLRGREKLFDYSMSSILLVFCTTLLNIYLLVIHNFGIEGYLTSYILSYAVATFYSACRGGFISCVKHFAIDKDLLKRMVFYSIALVPNSIMWWIINASDRIMITSFVGEDANGIYAISYKIPSLLASLSIIFTQAWSFSAIKENESSDVTEFTNKVFLNLHIFTALVTGAMFVIIKPFLSVYVAKDFYVSWKYTPYLFVGYLFSALGTFVGTSYSVNKDSKGSLLSASIGAVINLALNFVLIPLLGVTGAALATCISYFSVFIFRCLHTRKYIRIKFYEPRQLVNYLLVIAMSGTIFMEDYLLSETVLLVLLFVLFAWNYRFILSFLGSFFIFLRRKIHG